MSDTQTIKSARRVLEVLEYFAQGVPGATVTEIANALAYPQSSTSVLLSSLATLGYLKFDADGRRYSPTLRVMLLGSWLQDELFGQGSLVAIMERLRQRTGQTVMMGLRQGIHVRFILSLQGKSADGIRYPVGVLRPVCRSAVGKMLLSALPNAAILKIARHANAVQSERENRVPTRELLDEIAAIRERGWALTLDYPLLNRATLAVALPALPRQPPMALTVGSRKSIMLARQDQFLAELNEACRRVAERFVGHD
jgi:DNA-binding IclR family transcriptional regulator